MQRGLWRSIYSERGKTREYCFKINVFQFKVLVRFTMLMLLRLDVAREAFERHLRILNRRPKTIELLGDVVPSVVEVVLNFEIV